ncbi:MAG: efflux RND transporter permease subunit [Candidatus Eisenbacteria bacterium]|uniref:Efflux RND transporter permease subunit n=1 Tax=Eiseniibacteriota bacterium TaxID=2212470 RepID=A0A849SEH3_UNCEI|nr:efflux RND transporter permease subunit [Candidatus Eisenbacteria bacterium]
MHFFDRLIAASLRHRWFVVAAALVLLGTGIAAIRALPVDVFPDLNRPTVTILTEAPGLAPEEVEPQVLRPLETALLGLPGVRHVRSTAGIGLAVSTVEFDWGADLLRVRQQVAERLQLARAGLPEGVMPTLGPVTSIMGEIMLLGVEADSSTLTPVELRTLADWVIRPRLLTIPGIAQVIPIGGGVRRIEVIADPSRLAALDVTLDQVEEAVSASDAVSSGGYAESQGRELLVRNVARLSNPAELGGTVVVLRERVPVRVRDVAEVREGRLVPRGDAGVNGRPAVILAIQKQPGASTLEVTRALHRAFDELRATLPGGVVLTPVFEQARFIEAAIHNVEHALRDGALLVIVVLFLFLWSARTTAITLTAIPLSLVVAALVLRAFGVSINTMTLGGIAIAIGELVDDAIVDVENVHRRLRENARLAQPLPTLQVVYRASCEVRNSIVYATALVVLVFLPLLSLGGVEGRLFQPLGFAYIVAILASFVVSLTVTPVLCSWWLPGSITRERSHDTSIVRVLKGLDRRVLGWALPRPGWVLGIATGLVLAAVAAVPWLGREFLPPFNEGTATLNLIAPPGTSLTESSRIGALAERLLLAAPAVVSTGRRTGRAETDEHAEGVHYTEIDVDFRASKRTRAEIFADLRARLATIPGVRVSIGQPIAHRLEHLLSGVRAQVAVKLFGDDLDVLRATGAQIQSVMQDVPGVVDLQLEAQVEIPQLRLTLDREAIGRYGLRPERATEWLETALHGRAVSQLVEGPRATAVWVRLENPSGGDPDAVRSIRVETPDGARVPLGELARIEIVPGPNQILHEDGRRRIVISCNVAGRDLVRTVEQIQREVGRRVILPPAYELVYAGQFESQRTAGQRIAWLGLLAFSAMLVLLVMHFRSWVLASQVLLNLPLALIGAVVAVWSSGGTLSVATLVGFITLTGIAARNTILMITHYLHLMTEEGESFGVEMVVRGSTERLVPVLMTALAAGLALVPLALDAHAPGKEILHPVAVVILGGLVSSTLLDMVVTPVAFLRFGRAAAVAHLARHRKLGTKPAGERAFKKGDIE